MWQVMDEVKWRKSRWWVLLVGIECLFIVGCSRFDLGQFDLKQGKDIYDNICLACHMVGMSGAAPKVGQREEWAPRLDQGLEKLMEHALTGFKQMPARGGNAALTDQEVKNAVAYMVSRSW
jgi:cytochrome c5